MKFYQLVQLGHLLDQPLKFSDLKKQFEDIELHLTGPLQTNKVKSAISFFDVFQTLDREKLALEIIKHTDHITNKKFFIQVNTGRENNKSGIFPEYTSEFVNFCRNDLKIIIFKSICPQKSNVCG